METTQTVNSGKVFCLVTLSTGRLTSREENGNRVGHANRYEMVVKAQGKKNMTQGPALKGSDGVREFSCESSGWPEFVTFFG
jgi:hypothetical protein